MHHPDEEDAGEIYRTVNTEGTLQLARSAAAAGVQRFIYLSTILVNGATSPTAARRSAKTTISSRAACTACRRRPPNPVLQAHRRAGRHAGFGHSPAADLRARRAREFPVVDQGGAARRAASVRVDPQSPAFLGVQNLSSFIAHRLAAAGGNLETFLVADDEQVSTPEFVRQIAAAVGKAARLVPCPEPLLRGLLKMSGRAEAGDSLIGSLEIDMSKALATGWRPNSVSRPGFGWR